MNPGAAPCSSLRGRARNSHAVTIETVIRMLLGTLESHWYFAHSVRYDASSIRNATNARKKVDTANQAETERASWKTSCMSDGGDFAIDSCPDQSNSVDPVVSIDMLVGESQDTGTI